MDLRDYIRIVKRQKVIILLCSAAVCVVYAVSVLTKPVFYEARAKLYLRPPTYQEDILLTSTIAPGTNSFRVTIGNQLLLMQSRSMATKVADQINLTKKLNPNLPSFQKKVFLSPALVRTIRKADFTKVTEQDILLTAIVPLADSNLIEAVVKHKNGAQAMVIANAVVETGVYENRSLAGREFTRAKTYLEAQMDYYSERQNDAEEKLKAFNEKYGIFNFDRELLGGINRLADYQTEMEQVRMQKRETSLSVSLLRNKIGQSRKPLKMSLSFAPTLSDYRAQILPLQMEMITLRQRYTQEHPKVKVVQEKIQTMQRLAEKEMASGKVSDGAGDTAVQTAYLQQLTAIEIMRATQDVRTSALEDAISREERILKTLSSKELHYARLLREKNTTQKLADSLQDMLERMKVTEVMKSGNAEPIDMAVDAKKITHTNPQNMALVALMSCMLGITAGVVFEFLDDKMRNSHHVRRSLNLETLGWIPRIEEETQRLLLKQGLKSPLSENYHKMAVRLEQMSKKQNAKVLLVTSSLPAEGKSTFSLNLGIALARVGETVIVMDADLRRPALHHLLGYSNTLGFTSLLTGEIEAEEVLNGILEGSEVPGEGRLDHYVDEVLSKTDVPGLFVLQSGPTVPNPVSLLRNEKVRQIIEILKTRASFVIVDTPPVSAVADVTVLGSYVDGVLLVIDSGATRKKEAVQTKQILSGLGYNIMAVILNNLSPGEEEMHYYYYYSPHPRGRTRRGFA